MAEVTYLDLVEAFRRGTCRQGLDRPVPLSHLRFINPRQVPRDWAVPSYDFRRVLKKLSEDDYRKLCCIGRDMLARDEVVLPHKTFVLIMNTDNNTRLFLYVSDENFIKAKGYDPAYRPGFWAEFYEHLKDDGKDIWLRKECPIDRKNILSFDAFYNQLSTDSTLMYTALRNTISVCVVLILHGRNDEVIKYDAAREDSRWGFVNRSREKAGLRPVPPSQPILYVSVEAGRRIQWTPRPSPQAQGMGIPKVGHNRRGHDRIYKGRIIPVKACKVNGGAVAPPNYTVRLRPS